MIVTCREKGETMRTHAHTHTRAPNPGALGPEIEEGAVNRSPLKALLILPWGGSMPSAGPGAISLQPTEYIRGVGILQKLRLLAVAIRRPIGRGLATKGRRENTIRCTSSPPFRCNPMRRRRQEGHLSQRCC